MSAAKIRATAALALIAIIATALFLVFDSVDRGPAGAYSPDEVSAPAENAAAVSADVATPASFDGGAPVRAEIATEGGLGEGRALAVYGQLTRSGDPLAGVPLQLRLAPPGLSDPAGWRRSGAWADFEIEGDPQVTGADGRFRFAAPAGRAGIVEITGDDYVVADAELGFGTLRLDFDFGARECLVAGVLAGVVFGPDQRGVSGVTVSARTIGMAFSGGRHWPRAVTSTGGRFRIGGLRPGGYTVATASPDFQPASKSLYLEAEEAIEDLELAVSAGAELSGVVVDDRGLPVAGARVTAQRMVAFGFMPSQQLHMRRYIEGEETETDQRGMFSLRGMGEGKTTVRATAEGHLAATEKRTAGGPPVQLRLVRTASVAGRVVAEDGTPVAGSKVVVQRPRDAAARHGNSVEYLLAAEAVMTVDSGHLWRASSRQALGHSETDANGEFKIEGLAPGDVEVRASGPHRPVTLDGIVLLPGETEEALQLEAVVGCRLRVMVTDPRGRPVAGAKVSARAVDPNAAAASNALGPPSEGVWGSMGDVVAFGNATKLSQRAELGSAKTDADGIALIAGLSAGQVGVVVEHADWVRAIGETVKVPGRGEVDTAVAMSSGGYLQIAARTAGGAAASDVPFGIRAAEKGGVRTAGRTDGRGRARVGPLPPGRYSIAARARPQRRAVAASFAVFAFHRDLEPSRQTFEIRAGAETEIELVRPMMVTVFGTVRDAHGQPVDGQVSIIAEESTIAMVGLREGRFEARDLLAGGYQVYVRTGRGIPHMHEISLPEGVVRHDVHLICIDGAARLKVVDVAGHAVAKARVSVRSANTTSGVFFAMRRQTSVQSNADGVVEFSALPVGSYDVSVSHSDHVALHTKFDLTATGYEGELSMALAGKVEVSLAGDGRVGAELSRVDGEAGRTRRWARAGKTTFTSLEPGRYRLRRMTRNPETRKREFGPEQLIDVVAGETATVSL